jgi:hypothetical protein
VSKRVNSSSRASRTTRYSAAEHTLFTIDADNLRFKFEKVDHDYHIVILDHGDAKAEDAPIESGQRRTMIVEIPEARRHPGGAGRELLCQSDRIRRSRSRMMTSFRLASTLAIGT